MYKFKFKKYLFWKTIKVRGHSLQTDYDRMDLYLPDGGIYSIGSWSKYTLKLGSDWVLFTKTTMEKEAGQEVKLNIEG